MPFVPESFRQLDHAPCTPGDLCYQQYKALMSSWKDTPRWTTCHNEFKRMFDCDDGQAAKALAFFVWFHLQIMPYELVKEKENGTI